MVLHIYHKTSPICEINPAFVSLFGNINIAKKMWIGALYKTIYIF